MEYPRRLTEHLVTFGELLTVNDLARAGADDMVVLIFWRWVAYFC